VTGKGTPRCHATLASAAGSASAESATKQASLEVPEKMMGTTETPQLPYAILVTQADQAAERSALKASDAPDAPDAPVQQTHCGLTPASCSGVKPALLGQDRAFVLLTRQVSRGKLEFPKPAAVCRGVSPYTLIAIRSAPNDTSWDTVSVRLLLAAALCKAVLRIVV